MIDKKQALIDEINEFINSDPNKPILDFGIFLDKNTSGLLLKKYLNDSDLSLLDIKLYTKNNESIYIDFHHLYYKILLVMDNKTKVRRLIGYSLAYSALIELNEFNLVEIRKIHKNIVLDEPYSSHFQKMAQKIDFIHKNIGKYLVLDKRGELHINKVNKLYVDFNTNSAKIEYNTLFTYRNNLASHSFTKFSQKVPIITFIKMIDDIFKYNSILATKEELMEFKEAHKESMNKKINRVFSKISK